MKRVLLVCLAFLGGASGQPAAADCLDVRAISDFRVKSERWVLVTVPEWKRFKVTFSSSCIRRMPNTMRVEARTRCLSTGDVVVFARATDNNTPGIEDRCIVRSVELVPEPESQPAKPTRECRYVREPGEPPLEVCWPP